MQATMGSKKELVVPETLVPVAAQTALAPPKLPSAETVYKSALEIANSGVHALKFLAKAKIETLEDYKDVLDACKTCRSKKKALGDDRKKFTDPSTAWKENVIATYRIADETYEAAFLHGEALAVVWKQKKDEEDRQERLRIQREQEEKERKAEADRKAREAAEQMKKAEEDAWIENMRMMAEATAEEEGAGTTAHVIDDAAVKATEAQVEKERVEREAAEKKAQAKEEKRVERERRETYARLSTLDNTKPKGVKDDNWKHLVENPGKVDRSLCSPDDKKIRAALKAGLLIDADEKPTPLAVGLRLYKIPKLTGHGGGAR